MKKEMLIQSLIDEGYLKSPRIREAFRQIDRADFVLPEARGKAYGNYPLPIGAEQTISQPLTVAFMLEALEPKPGEQILDVGAGSGWTTALLAHIADGGEKARTARAHTPHDRGKVFALERIPELCEFGRKNIQKYDFLEKGTVEWMCGDGAQGLPSDAPFDKILASAASARDIPDAWRKQLKVGGRIVAPVGGSIWLFIKKSDAEWESREFPGFSFVPLVKDKKYKAAGANPDEPERIMRRERRGEKKWIIGFAIFFFAFSPFLLLYEIYVPHASFQGTKRVVIVEGMGSRKIGALLKEEGVIRSQWMFVAYVSLLGKASQLKPGKYVFDRQFDYQTALPELTRILAHEAPREQTITIPEGWNTKDIAESFEESGLFTQEEFFAAVSPEAAQELADRFSSSFLSDIPKGQGLEGYLFPDTYRVFTHGTAESAVFKMLANFEKKLTGELQAEIARQKKTIFYVVTMASLIEKEVVSDEDRALVSGILWRRHALGIPLQVDATLHYIKNYELRIESGAKNGRISLNDTKIDSPYNTYLYKGLPKGPIANPGLSAIRAAIYPKKSLYLYYLSTPDGRTIFSRTLEEHNAAKKEHL